MLAAYQGELGGLRLIRASRDLDPRQTEQLGEALRLSGVPALVLWGEHDVFLSIDAVGRPLAELLRAALIRLPGGHFTPLDSPRMWPERCVSFSDPCRQRIDRLQDP